MSALSTHACQLHAMRQRRVVNAAMQNVWQALLQNIAGDVK